MALVITIIVLMILAGVGLSFVLGDNGILKKAQESADAYKNKAGEESNALAMVNSYLENKLGNNTTGGGEEPTDASNNASYVGYYADTDGDGKADGIIYADLAIGGSGTWGSNGTGSYEYAKVTTGLKSYTVGSNDYTGFNNKWTKPVISVKKGSTGNDRFYVMALDYIEGNYCWYYNAKERLGQTKNYNDFGQGRSNTETMVEEWNKGTSGKYGAKNPYDLWGIIQGKIADNPGDWSTDGTKNYYIKGWYVPSRAEWAAFFDMAYTKMGVTTENSHDDYGIGGFIWTSTHDGGGNAYCVDTGNGKISSTSVRSFGCVVLLGTTF